MRFASAIRFCAMLVALELLTHIFAATAQPFQPISQLSTWYTDRNPVDIEIIAYHGIGNERRRLEPERVLRLRLERAYLDLLIRNERPISTIAMLSFDLPTGLPSALFRAPPEQVERRGDAIRNLVGTTELASRMINISLEGDYTAEAFQRSSSELSMCKGEKLQEDLFLYDGMRDPSCRRRSIGGGTKYVGKTTGSDWAFIECSNAMLGCKMRIPFEGFLPSVSFNETHLKNWKDIAEKITAFLQSKQYH
jgi:hypothetical protein